MNKYIITSPRFNGEIHVLYGQDNKLLFIDFMKADLNEEQISYFKSRLPVYFTEDFMGSFGASDLTVLKEGYKISFEQFMNRYGKRVKRLRAEKEWNKLSEADRVNAFAKLIFYERHLQLNAWKTKADPDTYLKQRYWEDEWK